MDSKRNGIKVDFEPDPATWTATEEKIFIQLMVKEGRPCIYIGPQIPKRGTNSFLSTYSKIKALIITTIPLSFDFVIRDSVASTTPVAFLVEILLLFSCRSSDDLERHPIWTITITDNFGIINIYIFPLQKLCTYQIILAR